MAKINDWLSQTEGGKFVVDADKAYPLALKAMGVDPAAATAGQLEAAYQCIKMKAQDLTEGIDRPAGALYLFFEAKDKGPWRQADRPTGTALDSGALRELYRKVSGKL